jgi:hypothetical protein
MKAVLCALLLALAVASTVQAGQQFMFSGADVERVKALVQSGGRGFDAALEALREDADNALTAGPFSVTFDDFMPPSGNVHDYVSMAKYWWPDPENPDGPWIRKDGVTNPLADAGDKAARRGLYQSVEALGVAYYFFEDEKYAARAAELIRVWFIEPETRMKPHMQYGQYVPGRDEGRPYGIIETRPFVCILDAVHLMRDSDAWTAEDHRALQEWFSEYLDWLLTSEWGRREGSNGNNHETACNMQMAAYALFADRPQVAAEIFEKFKAQNILQVEPDGRMPREIARTQGLHYSSMNLGLMLQIAELAKTQGIDLYGFATEDGRSMKKAFQFLRPYFAEPGNWPYQQITKPRPDYDGLFYILRRARMLDADYEAESVLRARYGDGFAAHRGRLYWPRAEG